MKNIYLILFAFCALSVLSVNAQVPSSGLVGYWPLNGSLVNLTSNALDGTKVGTINYTTDHCNRNQFAADFTTKGGYSVIGDKNPIANDSTFAIAFWINPSQAGFGVSTGTNPVMSKWLSSQFPSKCSFLLTVEDVDTSSITNNDIIRFWVCDGTTVDTVWTSCQTNVWQHYVINFNKGKVDFYRNAVLGNTENTPVGKLNFANTTNFKIGDWYYSIDPNNYTTFRGEMDEVLMYDRNLTPCEIQELYNCYSSPVTLGTISQVITDTVNVYLQVNTNNVVTNSTLFKVYPNPVKDKLNINISNTNGFNNYAVKLVSPLGQVVFSNAVNQPNFTIDLESIGSSNYYFFHIYDENNKLLDVKKIIVF